MQNRITNGKITVGFRYADSFDNSFSSNSTIDMSGNVYESDIEYIGEQLNNFLRQCGYVRKNDFIFMEDVNEEEYMVLTDCLTELRRGREGGGDS